MRASQKVGLVVGLCLSLVGAGQAYAQQFLFVSDNTSDSVNIPAVLTGEGYTVTVVTGDFAAGNATLKGPLSHYNGVFWSATGTGSGDQHNDAAVFTNLSNYVTGGGFVFVTGYDSVASPSDPNLITFLGGSGSNDLPGAPGAVINVANSLTTGVVDIRGVTPTGASSDKDEITGLAGDTVGVVPTGTSTTGFQWTLRTLGAGQIAYVSAGVSGGGEDPAWLDTSAGGAGAYNAALRNFAFNAAQDSATGVIPDPSTLALVGMGALSLVGGLRRRRKTTA